MDLDSILDELLCFSIQFWNTCFFSLSNLCTCNLQNAASYFGKTDSGLKLLPQQIETTMIDGSILAWFWNYFSCFLVIDLGMFSGMVFL